MTVYWYAMGYNSETDQFWGTVDTVVNTKIHVAFQISNTQEIVDYIKTGVMKHIDDVDGLCNFLKRQEAIGKDDKLVMCQLTLK